MAQTRPANETTETKTHANSTLSMKSIVSPVLASWCSMPVTQPLDNMGKRLIVNHGQVLSVNIRYPSESMTETLNNFKKAVFTDKKTGQVNVNMRTLYSGVLFTAGFKTISRMKFGYQPPLEHAIGSQYKTTFGYTPDKKTLALLSGIVIGVGEGFTLYPIDTIKTKRQLGEIRPIIDIIREGGLYNGLSTILFRNCVGTAAFFGAKEWMMGNYYGLHASDKPTFGQLLGGASVGGVASALITNPFEVFKVRAQGQGKVKVSPISLFKSGYQEEGLRLFWKGVVPRMLLSAPSFAIPYVGTMLIMREWDNYFGTKETPSTTPKLIK